MIEVFEQQDQERVYRYWDRLSSNEKEQLQEQINRLDKTMLKRQKRILNFFPKNNYEEILPFSDYSLIGQLEDYQSGLSLIQSGAVACLLLAGGQGSRFNQQYPKGMIPFSLVEKKSLFQIACEKIAALQRHSKAMLYLIIMTSEKNDEMIQKFFNENHFFGLDSKQVLFFAQGLLPYLDREGHLFLEEKQKIAEGPSGNGVALKELYHSPIWTILKESNVRYLNVIPVENPLALPFDPELVGYQARQESDIALKTIEKKKWDEKVGLLVMKNKHPTIIEYTELSVDEQKAVNAAGQLKHRCAHSGLLSFSLSFIESLSDKFDQIPLHKSWKSVKFVDETGHVQLPCEPNAWKFEMFLFDFLIFAKKIAVLLADRTDCFAPLKNFQGEDSLETAQKIVLEKEKKLFKQISGMELQGDFWELSADFYYPTDKLCAFWQGKNPSKTYVEPFDQGA